MATMDTMGGASALKPDEKSEWWGSPAVLGLLVFGITTLLLGFSELPKPYGNGFLGGTAVVSSSYWGVYALAIIAGGLIELFAGFICFRKGHVYSGTVFLGYGAFWLSFWLMFAGYSGAAPINTTLTPPLTVGFYGLAAFAFVWILFTLTLLINSLKHGWGMFFTFLFWIISLILLFVQFWTLGGNHSWTSGDHWATTVFLLLTGLAAWYGATARLTHENYGKRWLPY